MIDPVYLSELRRRELDLALAQGGIDVRGLTVLEIGAGNGAQLLALRARGADAVGVDLASSPYREQRQTEIVEYDGRTLPFADKSFDLVFSSHVLEHVADLTGLSGEMKRVLRAPGRAAHVMPSSAWKLYTQTTWPVALMRAVTAQRRASPLSSVEQRRRRPFWEVAGLLVAPPRHGEHGSTFGEFWTFRRAWWRARFQDLGWTVLSDCRLPIAYSGNVVLGSGLSLATRERIGAVLGGSANLFMLSGRSSEG